MQSNCVTDKKNLKTSLSKSKRPRKKRIYNAIRKQMEFYFSDANLAKDRFLGKLIAANPYIDLSVFLTFNKMKQLTNSKDDIIKSLSKSEMLQLSDDKQNVCRITQIKEKTNVDECTIYVESLPPSATHDWLINTFSPFGNVAYVSLPKFSNTNRIKQFGFVEFNNKNGVRKAINKFQEFGGLLTSDMDPSELQSIVTYSKDSYSTVISKKSENEIVNKEEEINLLADETKREENNVILDQKEDDAPPCKRVKFNDNIEEDDQNDEYDDVEDDEDDENLMDDQNKKKKIRSKRKNYKKELKNDNESILDLKIMAKCDWKRLRNKYLNLQRQNYKETKQALNGIWHKTSRLKQLNQPSTTSTTVLKNNLITNINFYSQTAQPINETDQNSIHSKKGIEFESGLICEIKFHNPVVDVKNFKSEIRQLNSVKYVDIKEGDTIAHLRFDGKQLAEKFVNQTHSHDYLSVQILKGSPEKEYWDKIALDRDVKLNKKNWKIGNSVNYVRPKRGREKIKKKLREHIFFDETDEC